MPPFGVQSFLQAISVIFPAPPQPLQYLLTMPSASENPQGQWGRHGNTQPQVSAPSLLRVPSARKSFFSLSADFLLFSPATPVSLLPRITAPLRRPGGILFTIPLHSVSLYLTSHQVSSALTSDGANVAVSHPALTQDLPQRCWNRTAVSLPLPFFSVPTCDP